MHEDIVRCLVFTADGMAGTQCVVSLLGSQGMCATVAECLKLLDRLRWHLLVIDASGAVGAVERVSRMHWINRASAATIASHVAVSWRRTRWSLTD